MSTPHGSESEVLISSPSSSIDASNDMTSFEMPITVETSPAFGFKATAKTHTASSDKDATVAYEGLWDGAVGGIDEVLDALLGDDENGTGASLFSHSPEGGQNGELVRCAQAIETEYGVSNSDDSSVPWSATAQSIVGVETGKVLHAKAAESSDGNGAILDNLAATSNGGSAYLHAPDVQGTLTVTIRHSTDNFAGDDTLLASFSAFAVKRGQRVTFSGTVKRYTRTAHTLGGSPATYATDLIRK